MLGDKPHCAGMDSSAYDFAFGSGQLQTSRSVTVTIPAPDFGITPGASAFGASSAFFINPLRLSGEGSVLSGRCGERGGRVGILRPDALADPDPSRPLTARAIGAMALFHVGEAAQPERDRTQSVQRKASGLERRQCLLLSRVNRLARPSESPAKILSGFPVFSL